MFLVRCPTSIQDPCKHPRTIPAEFLIFSRTKKRVLGWSTNHQNPHSTDWFHTKIYKLSKGFWTRRLQWSHALFSASDQLVFESLSWDACSKHLSKRFSTWPLFFSFSHFFPSFQHLVARVQNLQQIRFHKVGNRDSVRDNHLLRGPQLLPVT